MIECLFDLILYIPLGHSDNYAYNMYLNIAKSDLTMLVMRIQNKYFLRHHFLSSQWYPPNVLTGPLGEKGNSTGAAPIFGFGEDGLVDG